MYLAFFQTELECLGHLKWRLFLKGKEVKACDKVRGATKPVLNLVSLMEV